MTISVTTTPLAVGVENRGLSSRVTHLPRLIRAPGTLAFVRTSIRLISELGGSGATSQEEASSSLPSKGRPRKRAGSGQCFTNQLVR